MIENDLAKQVIDSAFKVHLALGPGLFESVYESILSYELTKKGLSIERQKTIPIHYDDLVFDEGFRADIVVENSLIVELKSLETILPVHKKQLLTYLKLADKRLGLLINFGSVILKGGIYRVVNGLKDKENNFL